MYYYGKNDTYIKTGKNNNNNLYKTDEIYEWNIFKCV